MSEESVFLDDDAQDIADDRGPFGGGEDGGDGYQPPSHEPPSRDQLDDEPTTMLARYSDGSTVSWADHDDDGYADLVQVDRDHDGLANETYLDSDRDGRLETLLRDHDGDGRPEVLLADRDHDGLIDYSARDTNHDGRVDHLVLDRDFDGRPDTWMTDHNLDGRVDEVIRMGGDLQLPNLTAGANPYTER